MADVIFEEDQEAAVRKAPSSQEPSWITKLVFKSGLAKTQKGAEYVLICIIILCVVLAAVLFIYGGVVTV